MPVILIIYGLYLTYYNLNAAGTIAIGIILLAFLIKIVPDAGFITSAWTLRAVAALSEHGAGIGFPLPDQIKGKVNHQQVYHPKIPGNWLTFLQMDIDGTGEIAHSCLKPIPNTSSDVNDLAKKYDPIIAWIHPDIEIISNAQERELSEFLGYKLSEFAQLDINAQAEVFRRGVFDMINANPQYPNKNMQ